MPELPEVETTRRGLEPLLLAQRIVAVDIREYRLRWPIPKQLPKWLKGQVIRGIERRAKYLLLSFEQPGALVIHLGMSGSLCMVCKQQAVQKHDHVDIVLANGQCLRYTDPRRFGSLHWLADAHAEHPLLSHLGPEPLEGGFSADYLYRKAVGKRVSVKVFIMNAQVVVGVGNIYANEALFQAGIDPQRSAGKISKVRYERLVTTIQTVLKAAIARGGTTLKDFVGGDGKPGYFQQELLVYGRTGQPCVRCQKPLTGIRQAQRTTVFCRRCQR